MNKFLSDLQDANNLYRCTNGYGSSGLSFNSNDIEEINLYVEALKAVKGSGDISIGDPNEYGITMVWCNPETNIATAIIRAIVGQFVSNR